MQASEPPRSDFGPIEVTVNATYHCGLVALLCGFDRVLPLSATARQVYHRAEYNYDVLPGWPVEIGRRTLAATESKASGANGSGSNGQGRSNDACCRGDGDDEVDTSDPNEFIGWVSDRQGHGDDGITASVTADGRLSFALKRTDCTPSGEGMFKAMMRHLGSKAKVIEGNWLAASGMTSNLNSYWAAKNLGASDEQAAFATFTGKMAARSGYTAATIMTSTPTSVIVHFTKPAP